MLIGLVEQADRLYNRKLNGVWNRGHTLISEPVVAAVLRARVVGGRHGFLINLLACIIDLHCLGCFLSNVEQI